MNSVIKSKVLLFLIALAIPTIVFFIMAHMIAIILKGNTTLSPYICITIITYLLIVSANQLNENVGNSLGISAGVLIGATFSLYCLYLINSGSYDTVNKHHVIIGEKEKLIIVFISGWALSVFMWTCNLFKKQKEITKTDNTCNKTNDNDDLIGGWYGVDSKLSCWLPVLAFEKNYTATFSDGKIIKEYNYHICCSTCIILTAKDGEKIFVKRVWVKGKPHLFYNEQAFTQDGKHSE